jgi:hypothetical protein
MPQYKCNLCSKIFKQKSHYDAHVLKKKKSCVNPNFNMDIKNFVNDNKNDKKKFKCYYCDKLYSRTDSLLRHVDKFCKNKEYFDNLALIKNKVKTITADKYEKIVEDNLKLIKIVEEYEKIIKEKNLLQRSIPTVINNTNINNNNGLVNNGAINTNTINIVQFGKEDINKCDLVEMMNVYLKSTGGNIFSNMLKYINFNPKHPENFNILMSDLARENVKIHNGKKFITKKFKNVKNDILNVLSCHINSMCDNYIENPNIKKNNDVISKLKINDISVKLINNDDISPLLKISNKFNKSTKSTETKLLESKNKSNECDKSNKSDKSNRSNKSNRSEKSNGSIFKKNYKSEENSDSELNSEEKINLEYYEKKREGLREIATEKIKDELYNNRDIIGKLKISNN